MVCRFLNNIIYVQDIHFICLLSILSWAKKRSIDFFAHRAAVLVGKNISIMIIYSSVKASLWVENTIKSKIKHKYLFISIEIISVDLQASPAHPILQD